MASPKSASARSRRPPFDASSIEPAPSLRTSRTDRRMPKLTSAGSFNMTSPHSRKDAWRSAPSTKSARDARARRLRLGEEQREAERSSWMGLPVTRSELLLPILKIISDKGKAAPRELYDEIGDLFGLDQDRTSTHLNASQQSAAR